MKLSFIKWLRPENIFIKKSEESKLDLKIKYFEYFISSLLIENEKTNNNHLNNFKVMKLLFFLCSSNTDLLDVFDNWVACPYGHLEKDLEIYIKENKGEFSFFSINRFGIKLKENYNINQIEEFPIIFNSLKVLLEKNKNILNHSGSYLIDLSMEHKSWVDNYRIALNENKYWQSIPKEEILKENHYYSC
jgi:hypothetical protein